MGDRKKNGFIKLPRALLLDKSYQCISVEAKVLYALMLDRVGVSAMNGLKDKQGKV